MDNSTKTCRICGLSRPASEDFCPSCTAPPPPVPHRPRSSEATVETWLETRWGGGPENPTVDEMRTALAELDTPDMEHPSSWLSDEDDWVLDVYESGLVIFSSEGEVVCKREGISREVALELWLLMQRGQRDTIRQKLEA